jgi:predicted lipoprotein with Yx(FWY)xxD motif
MYQGTSARRLRLAGLAAAAALALSACGGGAQQSQSPPAQPAPESAAPMAPVGADVRVSDSTLGAILTDAEGFTLYAFTNDESTKPQSSCNDACAQTWPPAVADSEITGEGVDQPLLGTTQRSDGSTQVTVNQWPLYRFAGDQAPGETTGQGSGGVWFVVGADGKLIREAAGTSSGGGSGY